MLALRALSFVLLLRIARHEQVLAAPLSSSLHAAAGARWAVDAGQPRQPGAFTPRHDLQRKQRRCADVEDIPVVCLNLTHDETALLPHLCWQPHRVSRRPQKLPLGARQQDLPPGVDCEAVQWWAEAFPWKYVLLVSGKLAEGAGIDLARGARLLLSDTGKFCPCNSGTDGFYCHPCKTPPSLPDLAVSGAV